MHRVGVLEKPVARCRFDRTARALVRTEMVATHHLIIFEVRNGVPILISLYLGGEVLDINRGGERAM